MLQYQRYTIVDCVQHMVEYLGWKRPFVRMARPIPMFLALE